MSEATKGEVREVQEFENFSVIVSNITIRGGDVTVSGSKFNNYPPIEYEKSGDVHISSPPNAEPFTVYGYGGTRSRYSTRSLLCRIISDRGERSYSLPETL